MKDIFNGKKITFWRNWARQDRILYITSLFVLALSIIFFLFTYHVGLDLLIQWNVVSDTIGVSTQLEEFQRNLNTYTLEIQTFFVSQHFEASNLSISVVGAKIYLIFIAFAFSLIMTAISMIKKVFWYAVSMTIVFAWLAFLKLDILAVLGYENNFLLIVCLILYGGISFLFHFYNTTSTAIRFFTFITITVGIGIFILTTSTLAHPYIHLTNYGTIVCSIATLIFIVMIAYDVLNGFFSISIQSQSTPMKGLLNFVVISLLYLGNLLMVYFSQIGWVKWDFNFFNPFYLFILSTILGIWANRRRSNLTENIISFHSAGAILYIGLAINAVMTFSYTFATTNDPMQSVLNDMITYAFLCVGILFVVYIVINFWVPIKKGIDVYEYIFEPKIIGHHFIRVGGLVMMFMLVAKYSYKPYSEWKGGYHNFVADVYTVNNEPHLAKINYEKGNNFSPLNHKSNYTLASLELQNENYAESIRYFERLIFGNNMSEFAYVNLSEAYEEVGHPYKSTFTLQNGIKKFPKSGILHHNLAYNFQQHHKDVLDSMYIYYDKARTLLSDPVVAQANILTLLGQNQVSVNSDSLYNTLPPNNPVLENNYLALNSVLGKESSISLASKQWDHDSIASPENSCFLYNYAFTQLGKNDTLLKNIIEKYIKHPESAYTENLKFALACLYYYDNDLLKSKKYLDDILLSCSNQLYPYYSNFAGTLLYKRYLSLLAQEYFEKSAQAQRFFVVNSAPSNYAYTVAENSETEDIEFALTLISSLDTLSKQTFAKLVPIFNDPSIDSIQQYWTDEHKFQYLAYHPTSVYDSVKCLRVLKSFKDVQAKAKACAVALNKVIKTRDRKLAEKIWNEVPQVELYPKTLKELNFQYLQLLALQYKFNELSDRLENIKLSNERQLYYYYLKGLAFKALGDTTNAKIAFDANLKRQPLFDKSYVESVNYLPKDEQYNFLVQASYLLPKSAELHKKLALSSLESNMNSYAEISFYKLKKLLSKPEFEKFVLVYNKAKEEAEKRFNEWEE